MILIFIYVYISSLGSRIDFFSLTLVVHETQTHFNHHEKFAIKYWIIFRYVFVILLHYVSRCWFHINNTRFFLVSFVTFIFLFRFFFVARNTYLHYYYPSDSIFLRRRRRRSNDNEYEKRYAKSIQTIKQRAKCTKNHKRQKERERRTSFDDGRQTHMYKENKIEHFHLSFQPYLPTICIRDRSPLVRMYRIRMKWKILKKKTWHTTYSMCPLRFLSIHLHHYHISIWTIWKTQFWSLTFEITFIWRCCRVYHYRSCSAVLFPPSIVLFWNQQHHFIRYHKFMANNPLFDKIIRICWSLVLDLVRRRANLAKKSIRNTIWDGFSYLKIIFCNDKINAITYCLWVWLSHTICSAPPMWVQHNRRGIW